MSQSRKMRRALKHSMLNKVMDKETTENIFNEYFDRKQLRKEVYNAAVGEMLLLFAGYQRICEKRGKKKISESVENFVTFCNDMLNNNTKYKDLMTVLKDETGYDFNEHTKNLSFDLMEHIDENNL